MTLYIAILTVLCAYFVKSATGFGPALIMIPIFSILFNPKQAIVLSTLFDSIAGLILLATVYRKVNWRFIIPVMLFLNLGIYLGARLMIVIPSKILFLIIGFVVLVFAVFIFFKKDVSDVTNQYKVGTGALIASVSGFWGGLTGMSGPLIVSYFKLSFHKEIFRDSLIAIFSFAAIWRLSVYFYLGIPWTLTPVQLLVFLSAMLIGLFFGARFNSKVNERIFNKVVAFILLIPAFNLLIKNIL